MIETALEVDGLRVRCFEEGQGPSVLLVHGGTLGFSGAMWLQNLAPIASHGFRVIAYDQPGFGHSDPPPNFTLSYREQFLRRIVNKLALNRPVLVGHSQGGQLVVGAGLSNPEEFSALIVLGTGSLLPPNAAAKKEIDPVVVGSEPTMENVRTLLKANLHDHKLITEEFLSEYYSGCIGANFTNAKSRVQASGGNPSVPLWQKLSEIRLPCKFIYGRQDRGGPAERIQIARQRYPHLDFELFENCHHILQWDQPQLVEERIASFARLVNS